MSSDWVPARASCTLRGVFNRICDRVRRDVKAFNRLDEPDWSGKQYKIVSNDSATRVFRAVINRGQNPRGDELLIDPKREKDYIELREAEDRIVVERSNQDWRFEIVPKWSEERLECDLLIEDKALPLSRVSQRIIGDFLFDRGPF